MSPRALATKSRSIVDPNMYEDGPLQPSFKGRDKHGAGVRPLVQKKKKRPFSIPNRAASHRRQVCLYVPLKEGCHGPPAHILSCTMKRFFLG